MIPVEDLSLRGATSGSLRAPPQLKRGRTCGVFEGAQKTLLGRRSFDGIDETGICEVDDWDSGCPQLAAIGYGNWSNGF
jgi:hypothetical protein